MTRLGRGWAVKVYIMTPEMLEELLEFEMRATTITCHLPLTWTSGMSHFKVLRFQLTETTMQSPSRFGLQTCQTLQSPLTNVRDVAGGEPFPCHTIFLWETAQLSQIWKSSLNTACKWPDKIVTQQVPFDNTGSEETDSGELDNSDEDDRSAVHVLALGRKDHYEISKGMYIVQILNSLYETWQLRCMRKMKEATRVDSCFVNPLMTEWDIPLSYICR